MNKQTIAISKLHSIYLPSTDRVTSYGGDGDILATTLAASMMSYGFIPSKTLYETFSTISQDELAKLHSEVIPVLAERKGAHVKHKPMYVNFPQQVMEASEMELFLNAITHYWSLGEWKPDYPELPRGLAFETTKWVELGVARDKELAGVFTRLLASNESLSQEDKNLIEWFMKGHSDLDLVYPETIPFKENLCVVAGMFLKASMLIGGLVKTATDVLRVITYLNEGDVSLASNTKFKSMPRRQRRMFARILNDVASEEDINRHRSKWNKVFHTLHIGEYKGAERINAIATKIRSNAAIRTFNGRVEAAVKDRDVDAVVGLLTKRPGEFARRLDHLFRTFNDNADDTVINGFLSVADQIPTRVICQVMGHLQTRFDAQTEERVVFPKGNTGKARTIPALPALRNEAVDRLYEGLTTLLLQRFGGGKPLGKVWLDPALKLCPVPTGQRSASPGSMTVARGTRLPFGDDTKNTLRLFIYWVGQDIDLSATIHDENFKMIERIGYTNLRSNTYESCHSGDITRAPSGASEFIDITVDGAIKAGARYVVMNVLVFSGPNFSEHSTCFAGWMTRSKPRSNEIYDPKTVEGKADLLSQSRNAIPVVFDLVERKAIWCDLTTKRNASWDQGYHRGGMSTGWAGAGNNVENNRASIEQTLKAIVGTTHSRLSLFKLFELHAQARGIVVEERGDADTVFSLQPGENCVSPYDINTIASEYLA